MWNSHLTQFTVYRRLARSDHPFHSGCSGSPQERRQPHQCLCLQSIRGQHGCLHHRQRRRDLQSGVHTLRGRCVSVCVVRSMQAGNWMNVGTEVIKRNRQEEGLLLLYRCFSTAACCNVEHKAWHILTWPSDWAFNSVDSLSKYKTKTMSASYFKTWCISCYTDQRQQLLYGSNMLAGL